MLRNDVIGCASGTSVWGAFSSFALVRNLANGAAFTKLGVRFRR
jgi:hypothetical protein